MQRERRVLLSVAAIIVLIVGLYFFTDWFSKTTGYFLGEDQKISLARCLGTKNAQLYTKVQCVDCYRQQELLGEQTYALLSLVDCDERNCSNLKSLPAWQINGQFYYGVHGFEQLSELSGCPLK